MFEIDQLAYPENGSCHVMDIGARDVIELKLEDSLFALVEEISV